MNAMAMPMPLRESTAGVMSTGRLLRAYLTEAKYEALRMLRAPAFAVPFLILPVPIYLFFGVLMAHGATATNPAIADFLFSGFSVMAVMGPALFGIGCSIAVEREAGLMKLKRALPAPAGAYLLSKMFMAVFIATLAMILMVSAALLAGKVTLGAGQIAALAAVMVLGSLPFVAIGLCIGVYASGSAAPAIVNLIYLPMLYLSGIFFPLPESMRAFAVIWPAFHLNQVALAAAGAKDFLAMPVMNCLTVLICATVLFAGLAIRRLARVG
ncbi:MAG: ABC transporter permease [Pseudomonadota bacterium]